VPPIEGVLDEAISKPKNRDHHAAGRSPGARDDIFRFKEQDFKKILPCLQMLVDKTENMFYNWNILIRGGDRPFNAMT
jgi:hypothetical protein